jgi:hypothetical protein
MIAMLATSSAGQTLLAVVSANHNLSSFATILAQYPIIGEHIGMAGGVTFFAPQNGARGLKELLELVNGPSSARTPMLVEWSLSYHVIHGVVPAAAIPDNTFAESYVEDKIAKAFTQRTGGQRIHIVKENRKISLYSAFNSRVNVTATVSFLLHSHFDIAYLILITGYQVRWWYNSCHRWCSYASTTTY